jgi:hypothetical protein
LSADQRKLVTRRVRVPAGDQEPLPVAAYVPPLAARIGLLDAVTVSKRGSESCDPAPC